MKKLLMFLCICTCCLTNICFAKEVEVTSDYIPILVQTKTHDAFNTYYQHQNNIKNYADTDEGKKEWDVCNRLLFQDMQNDDSFFQDLDKSILQSAAQDEESYILSISKTKDLAFDKDEVVVTSANFSQIKPHTYCIVFMEFDEDDYNLLYLKISATVEIDEDSIEVDYQAHDLIHHDAVDATCTTSGNIEYWDCIYCKKYFTDAEGTAESETTLAALIIPNGHILQAVSGTAATCTTDGTKAYWKCSTCNKLFSDAAGTREITAPEKIPASHTLTEVAAKAATCTRDGNRAYWKCSVCGKLFSDAAAGTEIKASETVVPAAHQYKNGVCTVCGTQIENYNKIIKGNGGTAYYGNDYSFTISADYKTVRETLEVKVDGKKIARSSFGLSEGSTIVTLSRDYINTLSAGAYDIEIVTNQGTARGSFRVSTSPKTGDNNDVTLWVTEEIVSLLGMTAITWYLFRRKET